MTWPMKLVSSPPEIMMRQLDQRGAITIRLSIVMSLARLLPVRVVVLKTKSEIVESADVIKFRAFIELLSTIEHFHL